MPMADGAAKAPCPVSPQFTCGVERRRGGENEGRRIVSPEEMG